MNTEELSTKTIEELCLELIVLRNKMQLKNEDVIKINNDFSQSLNVLTLGEKLDYEYITSKAKELEVAYPGYNELGKQIDAYKNELIARTRLTGQDLEFLINTFKVKYVLDNCN